MKVFLSFILLLCLSKTAIAATESPENLAKKDCVPYIAKGETKPSRYICNERHKGKVEKLGLKKMSVISTSKGQQISEPNDGKME